MKQHFNATAPADGNDATPRSTVAERDETVLRRNRKPSLLSMLSCCGRSSISNGIHFHANLVEDSVHVMTRRKRGQPEKAYVPRAPLSERLAGARQMELARKETSHTIEAKEEEGESELDGFLAADCVSSR